MSLLEEMKPDLMAEAGEPSHGIADIVGAEENLSLVDVGGGDQVAAIEQEEGEERQETPQSDKKSAKKPRKDLSLSERRGLLALYDSLPKMSQREAAKKMGVAYSTLHRLLVNRDRLEMTSLDGGRKRCRTGKNPDVEFAMSQWIGSVSGKNATLSGPMIKKKAEEMARLMNKPDFKASDGWLSRFKKREGLKLGKPPIELSQVDLKTQEHWVEQVWPSLCARYAAEDIWNADESAIKFRALPPVGGSKPWSQRVPPLTTDDQVTALFCCSMTGDKRQVFVVGEQDQPRCFQKVKNLPVRYVSNKPAYMTDEIFKNFLQEWDNELLFQNRKILLLLDTCPSHLTSGAFLTNIELAFLPPATTVLQPCEQGVVQMVKASFRRRVCFHVINQVDSSEYEESAYDVAERISLLDAAHFLQAAWSEVDDQFVRECWCKFGLKWGALEQPHILSYQYVPADIPVQPDVWNAWLQIDGNIPTHGTEQQLQLQQQQQSEMKNPNQPSSSKEDDDSQMKSDPNFKVETAKNAADDDEEEFDDDLYVPSDSEMRSALEVIRRGLYGRGNSNFELLNKFERAVEEIVQRPLDKETVKDFFGIAN